MVDILLDKKLNTISLRRLKAGITTKSRDRHDE